MTFWHALYQLLIGPLELLFEVIFALASRVIRSPGAVIVFLSLAMNILVLPLYRRADALQAEQRDQAARMKPWVDHIKKTFSGDERFMMLQTYYRQVGYRPTDALKGSVSLLLEVPFFVAAYRFLSGLTLLSGVSFGPIRDLGAPDALLQIGGLSINVLPILMTAINVVSAAIYMKGFPWKSKLQMYGMALVFLVLLYGSPAGLVFYWTLNNLFSLIKNIFIS
jgi:Preprotein translocase subunit YidC